MAPQPTNPQPKCLQDTNQTRRRGSPVVGVSRTVSALAVRADPSASHYERVPAEVDDGHLARLTAAQRSRCIVGRQTSQPLVRWVGSVSAFTTPHAAQVLDGGWNRLGTAHSDRYHVVVWVSGRRTLPRRPPRRPPRAFTHTVCRGARNKHKRTNRGEVGPFAKPSFR